MEASTRAAACFVLLQAGEGASYHQKGKGARAGERRACFRLSAGKGASRTDTGAGLPADRWEPVECAAVSFRTGSGEGYQDNREPPGPPGSGGKVEACRVRSLFLIIRRKGSQPDGYHRGRKSRAREPGQLSGQGDRASGAGSFIRAGLPGNGESL